jgi:hypothetical protein
MDERITDLLLGQFGTLVLALLVIWGFLKAWIVPGWAYKSVSRERDQLFSIAVPVVRTLEKGAEAFKAQQQDSGL